jgi:hypothetical protein
VASDDEGASVGAPSSDPQAPTTTIPAERTPGIHPPAAYRRFIPE